MARRKQSARQPKRADVMAEVARHVDHGSLLFTRHAFESMEIDELEQDEVLEALRNGARAEQHDEYSNTHSNWSYSIHGTGLDGRSIRVAVTFRALDMVVATASAL